MRFNGKTFLKVFILGIFTFFMVSCTMANGSGSSVQFRLPKVDSENYNTNSRFYTSNQTKFKVSLVTDRGRTYYSEIHDDGTFVMIPNVPVGHYELTILGGNKKVVYEGKENVAVRAGKGTVVNVNLKQWDIPEKVPGGDSSSSPDPEVKPQPEPEPDQPLPAPEIYRTVNISFENGADPAENIKFILSGHIEADANTNKAFSLTRVKDGEYSVSIKSDFYEVVTPKKINVNGADLDIKVQLKKKVSDITPDPAPETPNLPEPDVSNKIYCVDGDNGKDEGNQGDKVFKTITAALGKAMNGGGVPTIYVAGNVVDNGSYNVQGPCIITGVGNSPVKVTVNNGSDNWLFLNANGITLNNLDISYESTGFGIKIGSGKVIFGKGMKVTSKGSNKDAISLGSDTTISLSSPENVGHGNYIKVLNGGKIEVTEGFAEASGIITLNFDGNSDRNRDFISSGYYKELTNVVNKFKIINKNYTIDNTGKLVVSGS